MGSPPSPILADIFMNHLIESKITARSQISPLFHTQFLNSADDTTFNLLLFGRYVDDTLAAFKSKNDANRFLQFLNSLHNSIRFTVEEEQDSPIAFLDIRIITLIRGPDKVSTTICRKPTHSGGIHKLVKLQSSL